jgi:hypothetical protein
MLALEKKIVKSVIGTIPVMKQNARVVVRPRVRCQP